MQQTEQELKENFKDIFELFHEKRCKLTYFKKRSEKLKYICLLISLWTFLRVIVDNSSGISYFNP